jgi:hypothetical protein
MLHIVPKRGTRASKKEQKPLRGAKNTKNTKIWDYEKEQRHREKRGKQK